MIQNRLLNMSQELNRPLIINGAIGSNLQNHLDSNSPIWVSGLNIDNPEIVCELYKRYINAGCDILTTNTFRTNPFIVNKYSHYNSKELVDNAFDIIKSINNRNIIIAASNPPAEDCYQKHRSISFEELKKNHIEHIELLNQHNADFILNETFSHLDEIKIVSEYCSKNNIPYIISIFSENGETILSGEKIIEVLEIIKSYTPLAISFNCWKIEHFINYIKNNEMKFNNGFYLNCGNGFFTDKKIHCGISHIEYLNIIKSIINQNTLFIGSCCGSTPEHTNEIRSYYDKKN